MKIARLALILLSFMSLAAAYPEACNERLKGDRYYGAFHALVKSGKLGSQHLADALRSETPYNPLAFVTPGSQLSSAKRFFTEAAEDQAVRAKWTETKKLLAKLYQELEGADFIMQDARVKTASVILPEPRELHSYSPFNEDEFVAWTTLPGGQTAIAYAVADIDKSAKLVVATPDGHVLHEVKDPTPNFPTRKVVAGWHTDQKGKVWLYFAKSIILQDGEGLCPIYRMDWDSKRVEKIRDPEVQSRRWAPSHFKSVGNKLMVFVTLWHDSYEVSGGTVQALNLNRGYAALRNSPQMLALNAGGSLVLTENSNAITPKDNIVFTTSSGKTWQISHDGKQIIMDAGRDDRITIPSAPWAREFAAVETADGTFWLAVSGASTEGYFLTVYKDPENSPVPVFEKRIPGGSQYMAVQWVQGPRGEPLVALITTRLNLFADPAADTLVTVPRSDGFDGWYSSGNHIYFSTILEGVRHIFAVTGEERK